MNFAFDFLDRSGEFAAAVDQLSGSRYWLDDRTYVHAFGEVLEHPVADLLAISMAAYAADRLAPRSNHWTRSIAVRVPVHDLDRWESVSDDLAGFLGLLTDDEWSLAFVGGRRMRRSETQGTLFPRRVPGVVGLFSGGLDSLAGAARSLETTADALVLIGAASSVVIGRDQRDQARALKRRFGERLTYVRVPLSLRDSVSRESSQRARSFVFYALGVAAASASGNSEVLCFENGYGAFNPRLDFQQTGSQANRGTHPYVIKTLANVLAKAGLPVAVSLPHLAETKAEHIAAAPGWAFELFAATASCDSYPLRQAAVSHCGRCGSCVLRRQSLIAADLESFDREDYQWWPFERPSSANDIVLRAARQAWQFGLMSGDQWWAEARILWPSLALDPGLSLGEQRLIQRLLTKQHAEWEGIVESKPRFRSAVRWPTSVAS